MITWGVCVRAWGQLLAASTDGGPWNIWRPIGRRWDLPSTQELAAIVEDAAAADRIWRIYYEAKCAPVESPIGRATTESA